MNITDAEEVDVYDAVPNFGGSVRVVSMHLLPQG